MFSRAKPGDWQFSRSMVTDQMPKDIAMRCVREQMLNVLPEEVPYELDLVSLMPQLIIYDKNTFFKYDLDYYLRIESKVAV